MIMNLHGLSAALSAYTCSHTILISKWRNTIFSHVLCKSYHINSLTASKASEYFCYLLFLIQTMLRSSRSLSSASLFTGPSLSIHFQHFFLDPESSFWSLCSLNHADHTCSAQMANPFISLTLEASWVTVEHWKSSVEMPGRLHSHGQPKSSL